MKRFLQFFIAALLTLSLAQLHGQQELRYRLNTGDSFMIKQSAHQVMTQEMEGTVHEVINDMEGLFEFKVMAQKDETFELQLVFKDFAMKSTSNLQGVLMDVKASEPKEGDMVSNIFGALLHQELVMKMQADGKVLEVTGGEQLIDNMVNAVGEMDEFTKNLMKKSLQKDFGSEGLAKSFEQMTFFYPNDPKNIGDSWNTTFDGKIRADNKWTLEKVEGNTVSISGTADITMNNNDEAMTMDLKGSQETLIQVSNTKGIIQKMMVSGSGTGTSKILQMGDVEIPTTLKQTINYELITE